jgi:hypothetical protein
VRLRLRFDRPTRRQWLVFGGYCAAAIVYVVIGVTWTDFLLSFWVGLAYLLLAAWVVPMVARRVS